jgi:hypothetical protein
MDGNELSILAQDLPRVVSYFKMPHYQTVLDGRPLIFTSTSVPSWAPSLLSLRKATLAAGLPTPYVVSMGWGTVATQQALAKQIGADAISQYAFIGGGWNAHPGTALPYSANAKEEADHWAQAEAAGGVDVVPSITAGWDPRPREVIAPPWSSGKQAPGCNQSGVARCWVQDPTMAELTAQTKTIVSWVTSNANPETGAAKANAAIVSAWNEHDEGHWVCPSLHGGTSKLQAIQAGLKAAGEGRAAAAPQLPTPHLTGHLATRGVE